MAQPPADVLRSRLGDHGLHRLPPISWRMSRGFPMHGDPRSMSQRSTVPVFARHEAPMVHADA
ncbi:hypothetical protein [Burkholderia pseudomallei]|uniref:hypothetical protein n=1 Tax=Burkholderia pseudomallei TaxID=28450 RepID=UPI00156C56F3|nr:hypothetical protein [Burkholderia pseudomallei]